MDPDLNLISDKVEFTTCDGSVKKGLLTLSECSSDNQLNCISTDKFPSADVSKINPKYIVEGKKIAGIQGIKKQSRLCKNLASLTFNDTSYPPSNHDVYIGQNVTPANVNTGSDTISFPFSHGYINGKEVKFTSSGTLPSPLVLNQSYYVSVSSTTVIQLSNTPGGAILDLTTQGTGSHNIIDVGDGVIDLWETVHDNPTGSDSPMILTDIWGNDGIHVCDGSNIKNITSTVTVNPPTNTIPIYGSHAYTQVWEEEYSGLQFTNILYDGGGSTTWDKALKMCASLNGANTPEKEKWYLPTQKEILILSIAGTTNLKNLFSNYLSSTMDSGGTLLAGISNGFSRSNTSMFMAICVR